MSRELYEALSLFSRYLFTLLGVLIALRAFLWLLTSHTEKQLRLRRMPEAGMVGEFVVLSGDGDLHPGDAILVPWEGVMGSVRSCDVFVPGREIRRRHLSFSFQPGLGLLVHPFSGCEAMVNANPVNCHSRPESFPMRHGAFLQLGAVTLRLRLFAGLDPQAGFGEDSGNTSPSQTPQNDYQPEQRFLSGSRELQQIPPSEEYAPLPSPALDSSVTYNAPLQGTEITDTLYPPEAGISGTQDITLPDNFRMPHPPSELSPAKASDSEQLSGASGKASVSPARRRRRSDRWEADWSE